MPAAIWAGAGLLAAGVAALAVWGWADHLPERDWVKIEREWSAGGDVTTVLDLDRPHGRHRAPFPARPSERRRRPVPPPV